MKLEEVKFNIPNFGEMSMVDVFVFYDVPRVFVVKDIFETLFLFQETIDDEYKTEWLVIKISKKRHFELKTNQISLQESFKNPEEPVFHLVTEFDDSNETTISTYKELPQGKITEHDSFVGTDYVFGDTEDILKEAIQKNTTIFDVIFTGEKFSADLRSSIRFLESIEKLIRVFNYDLDINYHMLSGSTVYRFELANTKNLFETTSGEDVVISIERLLTSNDDEEISEILQKRPENIAKYNDLLNGIKKDSSNVYFQITKPNQKESKKIMLNHFDIESKKTILKSIVSKENEKFDENLVCHSFDIKKNVVGFNFRNENFTAKFNRPVELICTAGETYNIKGTYKMKIVDEISTIDEFKIDSIEGPIKNKM